VFCLVAGRLECVRQEREAARLRREQEEAEELARLEAEAEEEKRLEQERREAEERRLAEEKLTEERRKADEAKRMAELEAEAVKSGEEMEDEPTPKRRRTAVARTESSKTEGIEVDSGAQVQWQVDADRVCDVCWTRKETCKWRVSGRRGTACWWCSTHKIKCEVGGKLVKSDGGAVASGSGPKKSKSVSRKASATTVASKITGRDDRGRALTELTTFPDEDSWLVEDVPSVWDEILTAQETGNSLVQMLITATERQTAVMQRMVGELGLLRADLREGSEAEGAGEEMDVDEFEEDAPGSEEENAGGKRKGKGKAKSTKK
jgi:hypothetical protein